MYIQQIKFISKSSSTPTIASIEMGISGVAAKYGSKDPSLPKNGTQRVVTDIADGSNYLQVFMNGSWIHDYRCKGADE
jgi:hypothetical protein